MLSSQVKISADRQTDLRTPVKQYAPYLSMRGHNKSLPPLNPLPNDKIWDVTNLKAFADNKLNR